MFALSGPLYTARNTPKDIHVLYGNTYSFPLNGEPVDPDEGYPHYLGSKAHSLSGNVYSIHVKPFDHYGTLKLEFVFKDNNDSARTTMRVEVGSLLKSVMAP